MNRKVSYARFHAEIYSPGIAGALGTTLPSPTKTIEGLDMTATDIGLVVTGTFNSMKLEILIPYGNVSMATLLPLEPKVKPVNGRT